MLYCLLRGLLLIVLVPSLGGCQYLKHHRTDQVYKKKSKLEPFTPPTKSKYSDGCIQGYKIQGEL